MDTKNLKKRHQTWYARVAVPPSLQSTLGQAEIVRSLRTRDLREANRKKHRVIADIVEMLANTALSSKLNKDDPAYVLAIAKEVSRAEKAGEHSHEEARVTFEHVLEEHLERAGKRYGRDEQDGHPLLTDAHERTLHDAARLLDDDAPTLLSDALKAYLEETSKRVTRQTLAEKRRELTDFAEWAGVNTDVERVTRKLAGRYVSEELLRKNLSAKTIKDTLSHLSALWVWMEDRGVLSESASNPWARMSRSVKESSRGKSAKRRPWTDEELLKLTKGVAEGDPLLPLIVIAAYTGMRREEVASLRASDALEDALIVREGKTEAAARRVPLHPVLAPFVASLKAAATDEYLIPGLLVGGEDERRGHAIGKRFATLKSRLGFKEPALNFHTLRNAFMQRMENAEVPVSTTKLIVGHKRADITYGTYSPGPMFEVLAKAVAKVSYGELDGFVMGLSGTVKVTRKARRRYRRDRS